MGDDQWVEIHTPYLTTDLRGPPGHFIAPLHPRLDHSLYYEAGYHFTFSDLAGITPFHSGSETICQRLVQRLREGEPELVKLVVWPKVFEKTPPKRIRALKYRYRFSTPEEKQKTGQWMVRSDRQVYLEAVEKKAEQEFQFGFVLGRQYAAVGSTAWPEFIS
jgi:hypothetical protein